MTKEYLGDAVYVDFDGWMLTGVTASDRKRVKKAVEE